MAEAAAEAQGTVSVSGKRPFCFAEEDESSKGHTAVGDHPGTRTQVFYLDTEATPFSPPGPHLSTICPSAPLLIPGATRPHPENGPGALSS